MMRSSAVEVSDNREVPLEAVREELTRILQSRIFAGSERSRAFLRYVVETAICGRAGEIKEYSIGVEVFHRDAEFDPAKEAVVRVGAHALRSRLKTYFGSEGATDPVIIELPAGGYAPMFRWGEKRRPRWRLGGMAAVSAVILLVAGAWWHFGPLGGTPSIAVMPLENLSSEAENGYLAEGLSEELAAALTRGGLAVAAGEAAARHKGETAEELARRLQVRWVLEGSIRLSGEQVRVATRLVRGSDGHPAWSEDFDRQRGDIFRLPEEVAASVTRAVRGRPARTTLAGKQSAPNPEAYDAYLHACYYRRRMTEEGIAKSAAWFEEAVRRDSRYAAAYAGLADAYAMSGFHGVKPFESVIGQAREAAQKALALDPENARAHGALGWMAFTYDHSWAVSEQELMRAIELDSRWPNVRQWLAFRLAAEGRFDEAVAQSRKAIELEPHTFVTSGDLGAILYFARRYRECMQDAGRTLELDPGAQQGRFLLGACLAGEGCYQEAAATLRAAMASNLPDAAPPNAAIAGRLGFVLARAGQREEARQWLDRLSASQTHRSEAALIAAGLGENQRALGLLEQAAAAHEGSVLFLKAEPLFDSLHSEPRFAALVRGLGL